MGMTLPAFLKGKEFFFKQFNWTPEYLNKWYFLNVTDIFVNVLRI